MKKMALAMMAVMIAATVLSGLVSANSIADITTDKKEYQVGEPVLIRIINNCRGDLALNGYTIEDEKGASVFEPVMLASPLIIKAGGFFEDVWNQNLGDGTMAKPGTYIICIEYDSVQITILDQQSTLEITTDSLTYVSGEQVVISMTNIGRETIYPTGYWVEDAKANIIYESPVLCFLQPLAPGETIDYTWNLIDNLGKPVDAGSYIICSSQDSTEISVFEGANLVVGTDKMTYEMGEDIVITITNTGDLPAIVSNSYVIETRNGKVIFTPNMLAFTRPLYAGNSMQYVWDQVDDEGNPVDAGTYFVCTELGDIEIEIEHSNNGHADMPSPASLDGHGFVPKPIGHNIRG